MNNVIKCWNPVSRIPADIITWGFQTASCKQAGEGQTEKTRLFTWNTRMQRSLIYICRAELKHSYTAMMLYLTTLKYLYVCVSLPLVVTRVSPYMLVIKSVGSFRNTLDFSEINQITWFHIHTHYMSPSAGVCVSVIKIKLYMNIKKEVWQIYNYIDWC